jgi:cysteine-rich repeat protein
MIRWYSGRSARLGISIAALLIASAVSAQSSGNSRARVGPRLAAALQDPIPSEGFAIRVTLKHDDLDASGPSRRASIRARQDRVLGALEHGAFQIRYRFESVSGFAGQARVNAIDALLRHPEVSAIHLDYEVHGTLAQGTSLIGAASVRASGITGSGVNVAVLDSGIDTDHPDLLDDIVAEQCFCNDHPSPSRGCCPAGDMQQSGPGSAEDDNGHGTHTAGIITSGGVVAAPGVAPDAGIVAIKVLDAAGSGFTSSIDAALDWLVTNHQTLGVRVVNASLGDGAEHNNPLASPCSGTPSANAVTLLHAAGVAVFASAGNEGYDDGISEPACIPGAISVGGVYDAALGSVSWCGNSSCSTTLCTDASGPDVFVCHSNSDELLDLLAPDWRTISPAMGGGVAQFGGTSASSPYAAGEAALLLQVQSSLQPEDIRSLLKTYGPLVTNADNGLSFRRSDVAAAIASLSACGNGIVDFGEGCDDGNTAAGDCCSSSCQFEISGSNCDDGSACTDLDQCDGAGNCSSGTPLDCNDSNVCTDDSCDPASGCVHTNNNAACDDGNACTTLDACAWGACTGKVPLDCADGNTCTDDSCDPASGCVNTNNSAACDDGNACTTVDVCSSGTCTGGLPLDCDDSDACTEDSCAAESGCVNADNSAACDDGDPCTAESCDAITGCGHSAIPSCAAAVPSGSEPARWLLLALMLGGAALLSKARARASNSDPVRSDKRVRAAR